MCVEEIRDALSKCMSFFGSQGRKKIKGDENRERNWRVLPVKVVSAGGNDERKRRLVAGGNDERNRRLVAGENWRSREKERGEEDMFFNY